MNNELRYGSIFDQCYTIVYFVLSGTKICIYFITQNLGIIYIQRMRNVNNETLELFLEVNFPKVFLRSSILAIDVEPNTNLPDMNIHSHLNSLLCRSENLFQLNGT